MPYTLIKGSFYIHYPENPLSGPEPDGDTLKFMPDNRTLIENLPQPNQPPKFTRSGITTLRFEGIDTLETHFSISGDEYHQKMDLALAARDTLLEEVGFGEVEFFPQHPFKVKSVEHHPVRGYVLSNGLDTYGRTICFAFTGDTTMVDGSAVFLSSDLLDKSLNVKVLKQGMAYPAFYLSLPAELREHLKTISLGIREAGIGLWAQATATKTKSAAIPNIEALQELVLWPKLFRRLVAFFHDGNSNLATLDNWLRQDIINRDDRLILPNLELGNMHDLISVSGNQLKLNYLPEEVVIVPDDYTLPVEPAPSGEISHVGEGSLKIVAALINPVERSEVGFESVTIINTTNADIQIEGWKIADNQGKQVLQGTIGKGNTLKIGLTGSVRLSNTRDTITILDEADRIIDQVSYEAKQLPAEGYTMVF